MAEEAPAPSRLPWRAVATAGLVVLLLVAQYVLFQRHARREIVWAYPDHFDQAHYLGLTYTAYEDFHTQGIWAVVCRELAAPRPPGILLPVEGSLFLLLLGPSRLSALTVHFAHFALLQVCLFTTLSWLTRRFSIGWLGLGLLLAALTPFAAGGGMFDYRIDFSALCLFGILLCLVVRSRLFASWGWSAAAAVAGSWMVLCRSLTVVYLVGLFGVFFLFVCVSWWRGRGSAELRHRASRQLGGLVVAGIVVAALTGPFFWHNRETFLNYYGVHHLLGAQAQFRNLGMGIRTTFDSVTYYPWAIGEQHLGRVFLALTALLALAALVLRHASRRAGGLVPAGMNPATRFVLSSDAIGLWFFLLAALIVPYGLLSLDSVKNPAVAGIVVPTLVWLAVLGITHLSPAWTSGSRPGVAGIGLAILASVALLAGSYVQLTESRSRGPFTNPRQGYERIGELYDAIAEHCTAMHWTQPRVAATCLETDYFQPVVILPYVYERHHVLITPQSYWMGGYFGAVTEADALDELRQSDFVFLVDPALAPSTYPYDQSIRAMYPKLKAFCEDTLTPLRRFRIWHFDVLLYTRPAAGTHLAVTEARDAQSHH
jgi:hypothetical protein